LAVVEACFALDFLSLHGGSALQIKPGLRMAEWMQLLVCLPWEADMPRLLARRQSSRLTDGL
jgi:hypothetical protein